MNCIRCFDKGDRRVPAMFIYNGFSVCSKCIKWIREYERTEPLIWKPWEMNLRLQVTKKEEKTDGKETGQK